MPGISTPGVSKVARGQTGDVLVLGLVREIFGGVRGDDTERRGGRWKRVKVEVATCRQAMTLAEDARMYDGVIVKHNGESE